VKSNFTPKILALAVAGGVSLAAASALAAGSDAFNRPNLGASWVVTAGSLSISSDAMVGTSLSLGYQKASVNNTAASVLVTLGSTDLEYGAVALGNIGGGNNAFVKIQAQNGAGTFDHGAFYIGNNGSGTFFALASPVPSPAILDVFFCGTTAVMRITSTAGVQLYTNDYGGTFGTGGGLGTFGSVRLDNYVAFNGTCRSLPEAMSASEMPSDADKSLRNK
jgi:hypothetical protein